MAEIHHPDAEALADPYSWVQFAFQLASIAAFFGLLGFLYIKIFLAGQLGILAGIAAFLLAALVADFFSGIVHWGLDTWGSVETPLIGRNMIRNFRVHHVDEKEITLHGFLRTAGSTGIAVIPILLIALFLVPPSTPMLAFLCFFLSSLGLWSMMTNPIHKWAHLDLDKIPRLPRFFQKVGFFLAPLPHHIHHIEPYTQSYCITTGWCNRTLTKLQFFRHFERVITRITGALPRKDDIGEAAAAEIAREEGILS